MNAAETNGRNERNRVETKRPYEAPVLSEYGDIRQITQHTGQKGTMDGRGGSLSRTG